MHDRVDVVFRGMPPSSPIEAGVHDRAGALGRLAGEARGLRAVIDALPEGEGAARAFAVRLELHLPGLVLSVDRRPEEHCVDGTPHAALREAFDRLENRLRWACAGEGGDARPGRRRAASGPAAAR